MCVEFLLFSQLVHFVSLLLSTVIVNLEIYSMQLRLFREKNGYILMYLLLF